MHYGNPLVAKRFKAKVTIASASPSLMTFQFHPLVVSFSLSDVHVLALKG